MFSKKTVFGSLAGLGFLLGVTANVALAQMPHQMSPNSSQEQTTQFSRIEQPLGLKVGVTVGGIALIGLELWWFLWSKTKAEEQGRWGDGEQEDHP